MAEKESSEDVPKRPATSKARDIPVKEGARFRSPSQSSNGDTGDGHSPHREDANPAKKQHCATNVPPPLNATPGYVPESPPKFVTLNQIMGNMHLAHEIAMDGNFQLKQAEFPERSLEKTVKEMVHKAYWKILDEELKEDPPKYGHALKLLEEMRESLLDLLMPHNVRLRAEIEEVLDMHLIKQQVEHGALDFDRYGRFVISVMARICAPFRDESVRKLLDIREPVALFRGIIELLQEFHLDNANFLIRQVRPYIQAHSASYEQEKFKEYLETQSGINPDQDTVKATRAWLKRSFDELCEAKSQHSPDPVSNKTSKGPSFARVLSRAYMKLLCWNEDWEYPETLALDRARYTELAEKVLEATLVSSVLLVTYSIGGIALQNISEFKDELKSHVQVLLQGASECSEDELKEKLKNVAEQVIKEVQERLQKHGYNPMHFSQERLLYDNVQDVASSTHRVRELLSSRILEFVELAVSSSSVANPTKIPPGLSALEKELTAITGSFLRLVSHNKAVHCEMYADIIARLKES
ncbi:T-complex protein 11-like protein 1 [Ornithodoros turicata]|uniref:T-complex protein 11-like protein 1 n=1 Tax=Ornithodoros turicata TaxID=34597 RepID=UPI0031393FD1